MDLMRPWALIPGHGLDNETMHFDSGAIGLILGRVETWALIVGPFVLIVGP